LRSPIRLVINFPPESSKERGSSSLKLDYKETKYAKEKNIFHSISSFFSSFFTAPYWVGLSTNQKRRRGLLMFDDSPPSGPPSPNLPSLQIKIFLLILHPPFLKG
jgi:hypothetical protein